MRNTALHLAVDERGIHHVAAVIHADIFDQCHFAGVHIHINDRDVGSKRKREVGRIEDARELQAGLHAIGQLVAVVGFAGHCGERHRFTWCALHLNRAFHQFYVVERNLQEVGADFQRLFANVFHRQLERAATKSERAAPAGAVV